VEGKISYTRNGSFIVNNDDYLVTKQGEYVLDVRNKRIRMMPEDLDPDLIRDKVEIIVAENGNIEMNAGNQKIPMQTIGLFDFSDKDDLFEISDTRFIPKSPDTNLELRAEKYSVQQGMLELSNSNVIREMISTINTTRNYESLAKIVTTNNQMLETAVSVGRLRV
jgi:flagellar basal-body rod protein FlgG